MNPIKTIKLLDELIELGFPDEAFSRLHHFRLKNRKEGIANHRRFCESVCSFRRDSENERVQRRLEVVLKAYKGGEFRSGASSVFVALADAAFYELPPKKITQNNLPMVNFPDMSGIYIVTLNNTEPISVNAGDDRIANRCIKVTRDYCKFGQTRDLTSRMKSYFRHFGKKNVNFFPIAVLQDPEKAEQDILLSLDDFRVQGKSGRKNEWLVGISPIDVQRIVISTLDKLGLDYKIIGTVVLP